MTHDTLAGLIVGVAITNAGWFFLTTYASWRTVNRRKCLTCSKIYKQKNSGCKKFPTLFCSEFCSSMATTQVLMEIGFTPAQIGQITGIPGGKA
jgi:hypothetical protein